MEENNTLATENDNTKNLQIQDQQEAANDHHQEQDEEALSLSGLILNSDEVEFQDRARSSSADLSEHFEFFSDRNSEMSHAEDIIFCGKLVPYKEQRHSQTHHRPRHCSSQDHHFLKHLTRYEKQQSFHRRRSESLNDTRTSESNGARHHHQLMRNSRSLDYQKLYGNQSSRWTEKLQIERSSFTKSAGGRADAVAGAGSKEKITRPRWHMMLMFGPVKFPPEMDSTDMKTRQVRRNPGTLFASADIQGKALARRVDHRRCSSSWDLLRVLSCRGHASVAATTPFDCLQQI